TPGRNPSSTTSACAVTGGDGSLRASHVTISLPSFSARYHGSGVESPSGGSILTTRAPRRSSSRLANGPGSWRAKSATVTPVSGGIRGRLCSAGVGGAHQRSAERAARFGRARVRAQGLSGCAGGGHRRGGGCRARAALPLLPLEGRGAPDDLPRDVAAARRGVHADRGLRRSAARAASPLRAHLPRLLAHDAGA